MSYKGDGQLLKARLRIYAKDLAEAEVIAAGVIKTADDLSRVRAAIMECRVNGDPYNMTRLLSRERQAREAIVSASAAFKRLDAKCKGERMTIMALSGDYRRSGHSEEELTELVTSILGSGVDIAE